MNVARYSVWSISIFCLLLFASPLAVLAEVSVRPVLVDREIEPRGLFTEEITLTNPTSRRLTVYATVNEIALDAGGEIREFIAPVVSDRTRTVTSWLEITRGRIEIPPGESVTVPLTVRVHHEVEPGSYQAFIGFVSASKRHEAEAAALAGEAVGTVVRLELPDQRQEGVRISRFVVDRFVSGVSDHLAHVTLENVGDLPVVPAGELLFYDSRGQEVAEVSVNAAGITINPGQSETFETIVPAGLALGRHKANVRLSYGTVQRAQLMDTTFFMVFPWQLLALFFGGLLGVILLLIWWWQRTVSRESLPDEIDDVRLYVKTGVSRNEADHDINLKK